MGGTFTPVHIDLELSILYIVAIEYICNFRMKDYISPLWESIIEDISG